MKTKAVRLNVCVGVVVALSLLAGCSHKDKDKPAKTEETASVVPEHVTENDLYMQKLEQDIDIVDPDSLIEDVNKQVGDNKTNAELARRNAASGSAVHNPDAPAAPAVAPKPAEKTAAAAKDSPEKAQS